MKRIIYVLLMMLPIMSSAQTDDKTEEIKDSIVSTFKKVARKTGNGTYRISNGVEHLSLQMVSFRNGFNAKVTTNDKRPITYNDNVFQEELDNLHYTVNEFWNVYDKFYRFVPKSYNLVQRSQTLDDYDTIRAALGITPRCDMPAKDVNSSFRDFFLMDYHLRGQKEIHKEPFYNSLFVNYESRKEDFMTFSYASNDVKIELRDMLQEHLKSLKKYKWKKYNVSYEYSTDYQKTKEAMPTLGWVDGSIGGLKILGEHYVIPMQKEDIQECISPLVNRMIEKAKKYTSLVFQSFIDPTYTIENDIQCQKLVTLEAFVADESNIFSTKIDEYKYCILIGYDERGLHILEAECNNFNNPIPMMWMNIKTLYNDKVKWEKGLEP